MIDMRERYDITICLIKGESMFQSDETHTYPMTTDNQSHYKTCQHFALLQVNKTEPPSPESQHSPKTNLWVE